MLSFEEGFIESQLLNQRLLQTIRLLGEYKGKQELFKQQAPQVLGTLRQAAVIQSTESSNRIEGITVSLERIKKLVTEKTTPRDRSEQEIASYRDVVTTIHTSYTHIPSITRRGSISWESCCYQLIGSLSSGWDMLLLQKELKRRIYWMRLTICLKNSLLGNCRNGVRQWELIRFAVYCDGRGMLGVWNVGDEELRRIGESNR
jgi:hypothetical protein